MVQAMVVHDYESDHCQGADCGFEQAAHYNFVLSVDAGEGWRCCVHARTEEEVAADSVAAELVRGALELMLRQTSPPEAGAVAPGNPAEEASRDLPPGGVGVARAPGRPRGIGRHGFHNHFVVAAGQGCVDESHDGGCDQLFADDPESTCTPIPDTNPQKWRCNHDS